MRIDIHDVDHGACVMITGPRGHRLMLDCGQSLTRPWFPSVTFRGQVVNTLLLMNLDEDHVEDLEDLWQSTRIMALGSNSTVSASGLRLMKTSGMRRGSLQRIICCPHLAPASTADGWMTLAVFIGTPSGIDTVPILLTRIV
jgi:hypothetical protein